MFFSDIEFLVFFRGFGAILGGLGVPGPSKNPPKIVQDALKLDFGERFGRVFFRRWVVGGFLVDFGRIFGGF